MRDCDLKPPGTQGLNRHGILFACDVVKEFVRNPSLGIIRGTTKICRLARHRFRRQTCYPFTAISLVGQRTRLEIMPPYAPYQFNFESVGLTFVIAEVGQRVLNRCSTLSDSPNDVELMCLQRCISGFGFVIKHPSTNAFTDIERLRRRPEVFLHVLVHRLVGEVVGPVGLFFQLRVIFFSFGLTLRLFVVFRGQGTYP